MKTVDLMGKKFNRLTVVGRSDRKTTSGVLWTCLCDCGQTTEVLSLKLRQGSTKSCGCYRAENASCKNKTHGMANKSPTYRTWKEMWQRCTNPNNTQWKWYGGRGIAVCDRWKSFENFLADMGHRPAGKTIDRIDNDKGYSPENCQWLGQLEQTRKQTKNKLRNGIFEHVRNDRKSGMTYRAIAKKYGVSATTVHRCCAGITWG